MKATRVFQLTALALVVVSVVQVGWWLLDRHAQTHEKVRAARAAYAEQTAAAQALIDAGVSAPRVHQLLPQLVIADGKRGDVPVTAAAYAQALLSSTPTPWGDVPGLRADAVTANPLLGDDALEPLIAAARDAAAGVFVLVRTSNPGAADVEDLATRGEDGSTVPLWEHLARRVHALGVEAVTGATAPEHLPRMRELMPTATFLLPGVGPQGGRVEDVIAVARFAQPRTQLLGANGCVFHALRRITH